MFAKLVQSRRAGYLAAILGMAAVTAICAALRSHINEMTVALAMLLVVLFVASAWEQWPALLASLVGMLCLNYFFLPPIYTFTIADPKNWIALGAFFITALTAGRLAAWAKEEAAVAAASRSQARLASAYNRSLLEASLDPLVTIGGDGKINDVNAAAETITGYSRAELIGTDFAAHFTDRARAHAIYEHVLHGDMVRGYPLEIRHHSGHSTSVLYDGSLYRDTEGNVIGVVAATRPVSTHLEKPFTAQPDPRVIRHLSIFVRVASLFSAGVGLVLLTAPLVHINAVALLLLGAALGMLRKPGRPRSQRLLGQGAAIVAAITGVFGSGFASLAAFDFLLLGLALLLLDRSVSRKSHRYWPSQYFASFAAILALVWMLDLGIGSSTPYLLASLGAAITLLLVSLALLCARSERGVAALLASSTEGGALTRRLVPAAIVVPILIGALSWKTWAAGRYTDWLEISVMIIAMMSLLAALSVWNGYVVNRGDVERRNAERALHRSEMELREAQRLAGVGSWWWDPETDVVTWSSGLSHLTARDPALPPPSYKEHLGFYTAESSARLDAAVQNAIRTGGAFELELDVVRTDGSQRSVICHGEVEREAEEKVTLVRGTVEDITERKQAEEALKRSAEEIRDLYNHAPCGYHSLDGDGVFVRINDTELEWLGYSREELMGRPFTEIITAEGLETFEKSFSQVKAAGVIQDAEYELVRKDGTTFPVLVSASALRDAHGNYVMSRSTVYDITERKRAENEIRQLATHQAVIAELGQQALRSDPFGKVLDEAVRRAVSVLGVDYARVLELLPDGKTLLLRAGVGWKEGVVGHGTVVADMTTQAGFTLASKAPVVLEDLRTEKRFRIVPMFGDPEVVSGISVVISSGEGPYGILSVHTRAKRIFTPDEVTFVQSIANVLGVMIERQRAEHELWRVNRALHALSKCNEALIRSADESTLLQEICRIIAEEAGYRFCWVGQAEQDQRKSVLPIAQAGFEQGYLKTVNVTWEDSERGRGPTGACIRTGEKQVVKNFATDPRLEPWRAEALQRGYASSLAVPLIVDSKIFGALTIYSSEMEAFGAEEVSLLTELAGDLGFGITGLHTQAELRRAAQLEAASNELRQAREREIEIGFKIQQTLLLDQPPQDIPGLNVAALTIPSQRIDGDFYIFLRHSEECLDLIVGDVMGKGIPAALLGAATKSHFLRALSDLMILSKHDKLPEPRDIVMLAHAELAPHLIALDSFVTVCYARLNMRQHTLTFVDCGHTGVIHRHSGTGRCEVLRGDNLPLGVRQGEIYDQISVPLETGDLLVFYSDGITDARNPEGELFGAGRLEEYVQVNGELDPGALVQGIRKGIVAFSGGDRLTDDLTSVAVRVDQAQVPVARAEVDLMSDLRQLRKAREFVRTFCSNIPGLPLDKSAIGALELAANEAASNIIKHAYHGRADQSIHIEAEAFLTHLVIRMHHFGDPFDPSAVPPPPFDGSRDSGFGVHIISSSMDEAHYYRDERGINCIELIKFRKPRNDWKGQVA